MLKRKLLVIFCALAASTVLLVRPVDAAQTGCPIVPDTSVDSCMDGTTGICGDFEATAAYCDAQLPYFLHSKCRVSLGASGCIGPYYPASACQNVMQCYYEDR